MIKKRIFRLFICFYFLLLAVSAVSQDMLEEYLVTAAENNPGLKARFNEYMAALEAVPQAGTLPDPQLAFGYFIQPVQTRVGPQQFRISASQMFPWFGTLNTKENMALQKARAGYQEFEDAKSKLFNDVRATYYNLYFNDKAIDIINEHLRILNTFLDLALIKIEAGKTTTLDEYRISMEKGDLENQLLLLRDRHRALEIEFSNLLNTEPKTILLPDSLWNKEPGISKQMIMDSINHGNHQLLKISRELDALEYRKDLANKAGKPDFNIGLDYFIIGRGDSNLEGSDAFVFPRIGITIPLYRKKYKAMIRQVIYMEEAVENQLDHKRNILENVFEESWNNYMDANRRLNLYRKQMLLARRSVQLLETEYTTAGKEFEEILRMERKLLFYELEYEKALADKQAAISFMDYLMGR